MQWHWLQRTGSDRLIVVFGGWALGATPFLHLQTDADVLFADDYRDLESDLPEEAQNHIDCQLIAFSFGVSSYAHWQCDKRNPFGCKVAINGTLTPIDRRTGIAPIAMQRTIDTLSGESFQQFLTRCHNCAQPQQQINVDQLRTELKTIAVRGPAPSTHFDRVWISSQDRIFLPANQRRGWNDHPQVIQEINAPHVPFDCWEHWEDVLK